MLLRYAVNGINKESEVQIMKKNKFTLFDIANLKKSFGKATIDHDCLPVFLNSYDFDAVYETDDDSIVFESGEGMENINIEFFNFSHPLLRKCQIMYWENGKPQFIEF